MPFTFTRPIAEIRIGIFKISEKWQNSLHAKDLGFLTQNYLQGKYPPLSHKALYINGALCPDEDLLNAIHSLNENEALWHHDTLLAAFFTKPEDFHNDHLPTKKGLILRVTSDYLAEIGRFSYGMEMKLKRFHPYKQT